MNSILKLSNIFYKLATTDFITVPAGTPLYHGSIEPLASKIMEDGFLRSDTWSVLDQKGKTSGGTLDEAGLIWFSTDRQDAEEFARGAEAKTDRGSHSGRVFIYQPDKDLKLVNRYAKLNEEDAKILQAINPRPYDPIVSGSTLHSASMRMIQHSYEFKTLKDIFNILKFDGMFYEGRHYAIAADRLKISESYSVAARPTIEDKVVEELKSVKPTKIEPSKLPEISQDIDEKMRNVDWILQLINDLDQMDRKKAK